MAHRLLFAWIVLFAAIAKGQDGLDVSVEPRPDGTSIVNIAISKERLLKELGKSIPRSVALPNQSFGKVLIWRDMRINHLMATPEPSGLSITLTPGSIRNVPFAPGMPPRGAIRVAQATAAKGTVQYEYEHIWVDWPVKKVWFFKTKVPQKHSEWRTTTGHIATRATVNVSVRPTLVKDGSKWTLVLAGKGRGEPTIDVDVGEVTLTGVNQTLESVTRGFRGKLVEAEAKRALSQAVYDAKPVDLTDRLPVGSHGVVNTWIDVESERLVLHAKLDMAR